MNAPPDPTAPKAEWRAWARAIPVAHASGAVTRGLTSWPPMHGIVATYLAMPEEIDLSALEGLDRMRTVVPRTEPDNSLTLHWQSSSPMTRHPYGFDEPDRTSTPIDLDSIDVVLVPGLAFDRHGNRLGRGAGMYDRLLDALPVGVVRVGVATDATFVDALPTELHDQRVDWVATESGVRSCAPDIPASTGLVVDRAISLGVAPAIVHFPKGTKTSADAARAVDAELGSIAKSIVFTVGDQEVVVLCSGDHRVDTKKLASHFGVAKAGPATLDRVREVTGFVAGGTPGLGHDTPLPVVADVSLCRYRWVWSAGGTPDTVYPVALERLIAASGARWADVAERS